MIDVFAALSLASAAAKTEDPGQLFSDVETLYGLLQTAKSGAIDVRALDIKTLVQATARLSAAANTLVDDPTQLKNLTEVLASI